MRVGVTPLALLLLAGPARADTDAPATDPVLAQFVEESLAIRPELRQAELRLRAVRERIPQAGALPDPVLSLGIQNDSFTSIEIGRMESSYYSIAGAQTFPWPGKRDLRTDLADLESKEAEAELARARLTVEADVRRGYVDLLLARDRLALLARLEDLWQKSVGLGTARYEAGEGSQADILRAQLELNRLRQRRWALEAGQRTSLQILNRLRTKAVDTPIETTATLGKLAVLPPVDLSAAVAEAEAVSPELAVARLRARATGSALALAEKEVYPDFTVSAGVMPRGLSLSPMWQVGLSVSLPVFAERKQLRAVAESEVRTLAQAQDVEAVAQVLRLRVQERDAVLRSLAETIRLYQDGLLAQSRATVDSTLAQYRVGRVTFASVLEALAGYLADEEGLLMAVAQAERIRIAAAEVSLEPVAFSGGEGMAGASIPGAGAMGGSPGRAASPAAAPAVSGGGASSMSRM